MRRRIASGTAAVCGAALLLAMTVTLGGVFGLFSSTNATPPTTSRRRPTNAAPTAGRSVIGKTQGGTPGFIHQGGTYLVYADVADSGNQRAASRR